MTSRPDHLIHHPDKLDGVELQLCKNTQLARRLVHHPHEADGVSGRHLESNRVRDVSSRIAGEINGNSTLNSGSTCCCRFEEWASETLTLRFGGRLNP